MEQRQISIFCQQSNWKTARRQQFQMLMIFKLSTVECLMFQDNIRNVRHECVRVNPLNREKKGSGNSSSMRNTKCETKMKWTTIIIIIIIERERKRKTGKKRETNGVGVDPWICTLSLAWWAMKTDENRLNRS